MIKKSVDKKISDKPQNKILYHVFGDVVNIIKDYF